MASLVGECIKWAHGAAFGFIRSDDGENFFVHQSGLDTPDGTLRPGELVDFHRQPASKHERTDHAVRVSLRPEPAPAAASSSRSDRAHNFRSATTSLVPRACGVHKKAARSEGKRPRLRLSAEAAREAAVLGHT